MMEYTPKDKHRLKLQKQARAIRRRFLKHQVVKHHDEVVVHRATDINFSVLATAEAVDLIEKENDDNNNCSIPR